MTTSTDFIVEKTNLSNARFVETELPELGEGQVLLAIEKFAVTANNITYAVIGDQFGYWNFFPAEEGWGRVPVWGYARVETSNHVDIEAGERLYGYLPMSSHLIVEPGNIAPGQFSDMAAHRQPMSPIYNNYRRLGADASHSAEFEDHRPIFEPLFTTSFLIEVFLRKENFFGAQSALLTSASSKTGMGLAECLKARSPDIERIGLTGSGNVAFVEGLGLYDKVIGYDGVDGLDASVPSVVVDFAGNAKALAAIHNHFADSLKYSCLVGATHWDARGLEPDIAGPAPVLFFAPDHAIALQKELGPEGFARELGESWRRFIGQAKDWIDVVRREGKADTEKTYQDMLSGEASPKDGFIVSL